MSEQACEEILRNEVWNGRIYSNGWVEVQQRRKVHEPATGGVLGEIGVGGRAEIGAAAAIARKSQVAWHQTSFDAKCRVLRAVASLVRAHHEELVGWIIRETGSTVGKATFELGITATALEEAANMTSQPMGLMLPASTGVLSFCRRVPHGVVGIISPFNFPLYLAMRAVAPALATGNGVVIKPDVRTAISGGFAIARLFEQAGLPQGLLHVIPGETEAGETLCSDPNIAMIQFTGSTQTGRRVGALAGGNLKRISLELGGKNSLVILEDADIDLAASNIAWGAFLHQGQICMASNRVLVHANIAGAVTAKLVERAKRLPVGNPAVQADTAIGPLISKGQLERAHGIVQDSVRGGATLETGGTYEQLFYQPTVLSGVKPGMRAFEEELFAPVAALTTFNSDQEAVSLANQTEYGLAAGVISRSTGHAMEVGSQLRAGLLHINDQTVNDSVLNPFGGRGASGNGTNIGGPANWEEFTQWQWVTVKGEAPKYPM
jgi:benzaldehyde dehydrogenase (NAD)